MPRSTNSPSRTLSPDDQRAIAAHLVTQRQAEDRLRTAARCWPPDQRRALLRFVNTNRTGRVDRGFFVSHNNLVKNSSQNPLTTQLS